MMEITGSRAQNSLLQYDESDVENIWFTSACGDVLRCREDRYQDRAQALGFSADQKAGIARGKKLHVGSQSD